MSGFAGVTYSNLRIYRRRSNSVANVVDDIVDRNPLVRLAARTDPDVSALRPLIDSDPKSSYVSF